MALSDKKNISEFIKSFNVGDEVEIIPYEEACKVYKKYYDSDDILEIMQHDYYDGDRNHQTYVGQKFKISKMREFNGTDCFIVNNDIIKGSLLIFFFALKHANDYEVDIL